MRLIDADKLKEELKVNGLGYQYYLLDNAPTVEAISIKWIEKFRNQFDEADDFYDLLNTMLTIWERCKEENETN